MSADPKPMLAAIDCILTRIPIERCVAYMENDRAKIDRVLERADRANRDADQAIADADRAMQPYREADWFARALGRPDLADRIRQERTVGDLCELGRICERIIAERFK